MVFLPSDRVQREMGREPASVWYVPVSGGGAAILIKAPSPVLKAAMSGCSLDLVFGKHESPASDYLCTGLRIADSQDSSFLVCGVQREAEEHQALAVALVAGRVPVVLFNEMDVCVARSEATLSREQSQRVEAIIGDTRRLYAGPFTEGASHSLDCFCTTLDPTDEYEGAHECDVVELSPELGEWTVINVAFVGNSEAHIFRIDDPDEGETLERQLWSSLESTFPHSLHKSPLVVTGGKERELTDVLCHYEYGTFLIEAKDLSIFGSSQKRTLDRRVNSVQKQARKAIRQLVGAAKAVARNEPILSTKREPIDLDREIPPHCIVLLAEMVHSGDWSVIEAEMIEAMREARGFVHLLDFRDLMSILKASSGDPHLVDLNLMKRVQTFAECGNVHIRGIMPPPGGEGSQAV